MRRLLSLALVLVSPALLVAQEHPHAAPHWSYGGSTGPGHWGDLESEYAACKTGTHQSPIDIHNADANRSADARVRLSRRCRSRSSNNGHTIQVNYAPGSFIRVDGQQYQLVQFHFHHPSEETDRRARLRHGGAPGPQGCGRPSGRRRGAAPRVRPTRWSRRCGTTCRGRSRTRTTVANLRVNAADLLPKHLGYFEFEGSLTTPPCTEGVRWIVLRESQAISPSEIAAFANLYHNNARPTQPSNGRVVKESS